MAQEIARRTADLVTARQQGALTPSLPQALRRVLAFGIYDAMIPVEHGGGIVRREQRDWDPPRIDAGTHQAASAARDALLDHLCAIDEARLGAAIGKLRSHRWRYNAVAHSAAVELALSADWIEDLCEYPEWAIEEAFRTWRRTYDEYPTIAGIRRLCEAAVAEDRLSLRLITKLLSAQRMAA